MDQKTIEFIARIKLRFFIGSMLITALAWIPNLLTFAKVWAPTFEYYGILPEIVYVTIPVGFLASCYLVGHFWDILGFWNRENDYMNRVNNPQVPEIMDNIKKIGENVTKIEDNIAEIVKALNEESIS
jgi:hypothetical protein